MHSVFLLCSAAHVNLKNQLTVTCLSLQSVLAKGQAKEASSTYFIEKNIPRSERR